MVYKMENEKVEVVDREDFRRSREVALRKLETAMEEAHRKIESGRVRDKEKEKVRCKWIMTLSRVCSVYRLLLQEREMDEIWEQIDELEDELTMED